MFDCICAPNAVDLIRGKLDKGADPNYQDENGFTMLHCAVYHGNIPLIRLLLERGADASIKTNAGIIPGGYLNRLVASDREAIDEEIRTILDNHSCQN